MMLCCLQQTIAEYCHADCERCSETDEGDYNSECELDFDDETYSGTKSSDYELSEEQDCGDEERVEEAGKLRMRETSSAWNRLVALFQWIHMPRR